MAYSGQCQRGVCVVGLFAALLSATLVNITRARLFRAPGLSGANAIGRHNVLFVVRTWHNSYPTKVEAILRTWGGAVNNSLVIVGDTPSTSPPVYGASACPNDHSAGLACKDGYALSLAADRLATSSEYSWVFVVDDDVYVRSRDVEMALVKLNASKAQVLGIPGCGPELCGGAGGMCGGAGYAISRAALERLVSGRPAQALADELVETCKGAAGGWDDIAVTCALRSRKVHVDNLDGLHGWRARDHEEFLNWIHDKSPAPLTFHYINASEMDAIHAEFLMKDNSTARTGSRLLQADHMHGAGAFLAEPYDELGLERYRAQASEYVKAMNTVRYSKAPRKQGGKV